VSVVGWVEDQLVVGWMEGPWLWWYSVDLGGMGSAGVACLDSVEGVVGVEVCGVDVGCGIEDCWIGDVGLCSV